MSKPPLDKITKHSQNLVEDDNTEGNSPLVKSTKNPKVQKLEVESLNKLILLFLILSLEGPKAADDERNRWKAYAKCYIAKQETTCDAAVRHIRREIFREIKKVLFNWLVIVGVFATITTVFLA